jgi:hypothetical protein
MEEASEMAMTEAAAGPLGALLINAGIPLARIAVDELVVPFARSTLRRVRARLERQGPARQIPIQPGTGTEAAGISWRDFNSISDFWRADPRTIVGTYVSLNGALSTYLPLLVGPPNLKREIHRAYRRSIPEEDYRRDKTTVDAMLAFTSGQMVWRLQPTDSPWTLLGLYHSIVRNSLLVVADRAYYATAVEPIFLKGNNSNVVEAQVKGQVVPLEDNLLRDFLESHRLQGFIRPRLLRESLQPPVALKVEGRVTEISYLGPARYLDGDVWVGVEVQGEQFFVSRFVDLADDQDLSEELAGLESDVKEYLGNGQVVFQFDQVNKLFAASSKEQLINEALNPVSRR